jgi:hypothetical protein
MGAWVACTAVAYAQSTEAATESARNAPLFTLIAFLCLFGYLIFNNHLINSRLQQMSRGVSTEAEPTGAAAPFAWDDIGDDAAAVPLFGERVTISRSGLYLVASSDDSLLTTLAANMIYQALAVEDVTLLYVSQRMARDELGRSLLSLEAGASWEQMAAAQRSRTRRKLQAELEKYETNLFALEEMDWTPDRLFAAWQQLKGAGQSVAAILVDDPSLVRLPEARHVEIFDRLRLLSVKCGVPVFVLASTAASIQATAGDRLTGVLEVELSSPNSKGLVVSFIKYPEAPPTASFELDSASGQILVKG